MSISPRLLLLVSPIALSIGCIGAVQAEPAANADGLKANYSARTQRVLLRWKGKIAPPMARQFKAAIKTWAARAPNGVMISLNSHGGKIKEARRMMTLIGELKHTHKVRTFVGPGRICGSACIPVFLAADQRHASRASLWKFHEITASKRAPNGANILQPKKTRRLFKEIFLPAGVSTRWLKKLMRKIESVDYWMTGAQLETTGSGIATKYTTNIRKRGNTQRGAD